MRVARSNQLLALLVLIAACDTPVQPSMGPGLEPDGSPLATAAVTPYEQVAGASVTGGAWRDTDLTDGRSLRHFSVTANTHGGMTSGHYNLVSGSSDVVVKGDVTCLAVVGNRAYVGGTIDKAGLPFPPEIVEQITGVAVEVVDNGNGSGVDELSSLGLFLNNPEGPQTFCDDATPGPVSPVDRGSYQIH